jgi:hypothetical protein
MAHVKTELLLKINFTLGAAEGQDVGTTTPSGTRLMVPVLGGTFTGADLQGTVLTEGGNWALQHADGVTVLEVRVTLRTHDHYRIAMTARGLDLGAPEGRQRVRQGAPVAPAAYALRTTIHFETGSAPYEWLNRTGAVGVGYPTPTGVGYKVYALR